MSSDKIPLRPRGGVVAIAKSIREVPIRLTEERWSHIIEYHGELARFLDQILLAVADPDLVFESPKEIEPNFVAIKRFVELVQYRLADRLAVHYKEVSKDDGFILTVFPISDERARRRYRLWQRLK